MTHQHVILLETVFQKVEKIVSLVRKLKNSEDPSWRAGEHSPNLLGISCNKLAIISIEFGKGLLSKCSPIILILTSSSENSNISLGLTGHNWYKIINSDKHRLVENSHFNTNQTISRILDIFIHEDFGQTILTRCKSS